jgi:hypothetical protein
MLLHDHFYLSDNSHTDVYHSGATQFNWSAQGLLQQTCLKQVGQQVDMAAACHA